MLNNQYKIRTINCIACGTTVTKRAPEGRKYCSLTCYRSSEKPQRKSGELICCKECGIERYKTKSQLQNTEQSFCSLTCANKWQARNKITYKCEVCSKDFRRSPSMSHAKYTRRFCSVNCRNSSPDWAKSSYIKANTIQNKNKKPNKLECAGAGILDFIGIEYESQKLLFDKFCVDIFLPRQNIVIQWDGEYWHGHHSKLKDGIPDKRQKKRMDLDVGQDAYLKKCGMTVLRFWESEVLNRKEYVIEAIKRAIQQLA